MKCDKDKKRNNINFTNYDLEVIELIKQQMFAAILGIYAEILYYKACYEEILEIFNEAKGEKDEFIDSDRTFLESARFFLISQLIFTKAAFQYYYITIRKNNENNINDDLSPEVKINISCILNSLGNLYFLDAMEETCAKKDNEPIIGE